jgi:hypothetical protein
VLPQILAKSADVRSAAECIDTNRPDQEDYSSRHTHSYPPQYELCPTGEVKIPSGDMDGTVDKVHEEDDGEASQRRLRDVVVWYSFYGTTCLVPRFTPNLLVISVAWAHTRFHENLSLPWKKSRGVLSQCWSVGSSCRAIISAIVKLGAIIVGVSTSIGLWNQQIHVANVASDETQGSKLESGDGKSLSCATSDIQNEPANLKNGDGFNKTSRPCFCRL